VTKNPEFPRNNEKQKFSIPSVKNYTALKKKGTQNVPIHNVVAAYMHDA